eukprot:6434795-Prymnesium_polylepis.1
MWREDEAIPFGVASRFLLHDVRSGRLELGRGNLLERAVRLADPLVHLLEVATVARTLERLEHF